MARRKNDMGMSLMGGSSSAAEIDSSVDELEDLLQQIEMGLEEMATIGDPGDRQQKVKSLSEKMTRARNVHHSMKVELQDLDDRDKKTYQTKVSAFTPRLSRLQEELKLARAREQDWLDKDFAVEQARVDTVLVNTETLLGQLYMVHPA